MADVIEIFADGTVIERDFTAQELAQKEADKLAFEAVKVAKAEAQAKRSAALAKLAVLGLDENDLKALGF